MVEFPSKIKNTQKGSFSILLCGLGVRFWAFRETKER